MPDSTSTTSGETAAEPDEATPAEDQEVFVNRAARRAKGKGGAKPEVFAKGQAPTGRGAVQSPRQYGTRRSG